MGRAGLAAVLKSREEECERLTLELEEAQAQLRREMERTNAMREQQDALADLRRRYPGMSLAGAAGQP